MIMGIRVIGMIWEPGMSSRLHGNDGGVSWLPAPHGGGRVSNPPLRSGGSVVFEQFDVVPGIDGLRRLEGHFRHSQT